MIYLCGTMSHQKNFGSVWRKKLQKWFEKHNLKVYNPCAEETKLTCQVTYKWEKIPQADQEKIILKDLKAIQDSLFVVCYFTKYSTGTVSELTHALYVDSPVFFVTKRRLKGWPLTVSRSGDNRVFKTFRGLKRYLKRKYL